MADVRWKMAKPECFHICHLPFHIRPPFFSGLLGSASAPADLSTQPRRDTDLMASGDGCRGMYTCSHLMQVALATDLQRSFGGSDTTLWRDRSTYSARRVPGLAA